MSHTAAGADKWRYSLNWGTTYSDWLDYKGGNDTLAPTAWSGTKAQAWDGDHVIVQYWNRIAGSSNHVQHGDANWDKKPPRRFPHLWLEGPWNQHGFDAGLANQMKLDSKSGLWTFNFMAEWPAQSSVSMWGINPDGQPDQTQIFGDVDGDNVLDRLPLKTLLGNYINVTDVPRSPHLSYRISLNDATFRYELVPVGSLWAQLTLWILLALIPILTGVAAIFAYLQSFSQVKFNKIGVADKHRFIPVWVQRGFKPRQEKISRASPHRFGHSPRPMEASRNGSIANSFIELPNFGVNLNQGNPLYADAGAPDRRSVLIATMEYDIEDWGIKIKIGGLGVMAQLM